MNIQRARVELAEVVLPAVLGAAWHVTTETEPDIHAPMCVVGHAVEIIPITYTAYQAVLEVRLWVSEGDDVNGVGELYELVSPGERSLLAALANASTVDVGPVRAGNIGRRDEGPSGFLACDLRVPIKVVR